jgi:hypothetical protein
MVVYVRNQREMPYELRVELEEAGLDTYAQLLEAARTPEGRQDLATQLGVEPDVVLNLARQADLTRVKGIGGVFATLLAEEVGVHSIQELAGCDPDQLHAQLLELDYPTRRAGRPPTFPAVKSWVAHAQTLPEVLEN